MHPSDGTKSAFLHRLLRRLGLWVQLVVDETRDLHQESGRAVVGLCSDPTAVDLPAKVESLGPGCPGSSSANRVRKMTFASGKIPHGLMSLKVGYVRLLP